MKNRRILISLGVLAGLMLVGACRAEETRDFERYKVILDRAPFGAVGPEKVPDKQPPFVTRFFLVGFVRSNGLDGVVQAVIDDRGGTHRTYFKAAGETIDDVKIVSVEALYPYSVVIERGLETGTLTFPEVGGAIAPPSGTPLPGQAPGPPLGGAPQPEAGGPTIRRIPFRRPNQ